MLSLSFCNFTVCKDLRVFMDYHAESFAAELGLLHRENLLSTKRG
jgi:hypothetical protein